MSTIKVILGNILSKNYQFCSICFETLAENYVQIHDEYVLREEGLENIKVSDVLSAILDEEVFNIVSTFGNICKNCVKIAAISYKFVMKCKENSIGLRNSIEGLSSCIENTSENLYFYKTLFLTLNPNDYSTQQFYDTISPFMSDMSVSKRLESLVNEPPQTLNDNPYIEKECGKKTAMKSEKTKKGNRCLKTVPIKTIDMLYDKNDPTDLKCKGCERIYPTLSNLRNHYIRVHAPKDYKCPTCNRRFGSIGFLEAHKFQSHRDLICSECGKTFHNRHTLKMHEIGHYNKIVCADCGRVYRSQTTYKKHIDLNVCGQTTRANPSEAKFTCDYCNKRYTQKVTLRVHIQYEHLNYKAHVCKWCNKKFWAQSRLEAHIVKHTQEKKFNCTVCGGKFVSKESLLYHTRIHTGEKPYACHLCDNKFLSSSRRADHVKRHHTGTILRCEICKAQFYTQSSLEQHKKVHAATEGVSTENCSKELVNTLKEDNINLESEDELNL